MSLGKKLANYRKAAGLTQQQLGEELNLSPQAISKWENDLAEPDLATLRILAGLYKVSIGEMLDTGSGVIKDRETEKEDSRPEEKKEVIGFCKTCGITVTEETIGEKSPAIICKKCLDKRITNEKNAKREAELKEKNRISDIRRSHTRKLRVSLIVSGILSILVLILSLYYIVSNNDYTLLPTAIVLSYVIFTFVACMFYDCFVKEVFIDWTTKSFQWPGLIFSFDLDGIIWLIGMKLLFWALGLLLGLLCSLLGLTLGMICAPFLFPFIMVNMKRSIDNGTESKYFE